MANYLSLLIALTIINLHLISSSHPNTTTPPPHSTTSSPSPRFASPQPPPPPPPPHATTTTLHQPTPLEQETLNTVIDSLTSQPGFQLWANLLSSSTATDLVPITATLFIPSNTAISHLPTPTSSPINFDPFLIPYHITPTRLSFSDLHLFKPFSRFPTLLPSKSILVTNTSSHNFTLDNSRITHPDMFLSSSIAVHGIQHILDYSLFGNDDSPPPPPPRNLPFLPLDQVLGQIRSDSPSCLFPVIPLFYSLLLAAVFVFNIL